MNPEDIEVEIFQNTDYKKQYIAFCPQVKFGDYNRILKIQQLLVTNGFVVIKTEIPYIHLIKSEVK